MIGTPPGEGHALPVAMVSDMLRGAGFEVVDLGTDLPVEEFVEAVKAAAPLTAIAVSVTNSASLGPAQRLVGELHKAVEAPVVLGGAAVDGKQHADKLGADAYADDGPGAVAYARGLIGR